ncbi:MAG: two-component system OmpR family alkaline phosphatase synthesis response regulator PhoP [Stygiobacter sp.]|nr:MAG: two-component system OmpR family alkaline phosphatase synthesis response regulator PhoP [Stygiobacter sp.]KAF0216599.1 MAG: two-component system OmpR family alkaline phosphatase synthesis response regulator [Ignavibacteria bacterium]
MQKILIVEDEPNMRMGLKDNLEFEGYTVETATDGEAGLSMIMTNTFDLVILDVMMPKISGFDVCKHAREKGIKTPIILLTAKGEEIDKIVGLELGADDYITKPFSLRELLARIKAILRRVESPTTQIPVVHIGKLETNFSTYNAYEEGTNVPMSHKEFELLRYLYERRNQTVSRDDILKNVWQQEATTTRTIDNFVVKLRQKIEINPNEPKIIITVHGIGYKLIQ